jgi:periplasmic protein CpxP/Spy
MNRHTILAATFFVFGLTSPLALHAFAPPEPAAQNPPDAAAGLPSTTDVANTLQQKLGLTDDQKNQIAPILADRRAKITALRNDQSLSRFQRMRQAKQVIGDSDKKINAFLTPDQQKQYAELEKQMRDQMRERMQHGQGGGLN